MPVVRHTIAAQHTDMLRAVHQAPDGKDGDAARRVPIYSIDASCPTERAVALFADIRRLISVHPLMIGTRELPAAPAALHSYSVTDRLAVGPLRFRITYRADVLEAGDGRVTTRARRNPSTTLLSRVHVTQTSESVPLRRPE